MLREPVELMLQDESNYASLFHLNHQLRSWSKVAIVHHLNSNEPRAAWKNRVIRAMEKRFLASVDGHIFNSPATQSEVHSLVGSSRPSIVAYPAGDRLNAEITEAEIQARATQPGPLRLIFVGNLQRRKGLVYLLEALARLPQGTARLDVVGLFDLKRRYSRMIERFIRENALGERVSILGRLDDADLAQCYKKNHVVAVPSLLEGFGTIYAEGMAFGLPAIASSEPSRAIIDDGVNGFVTSPGDVNRLCELIQRLHADRELLAEMSVAARERFLRHPTWTETTTRIHEFLCTLT